VTTHFGQCFATLLMGSTLVPRLELTNGGVRAGFVSSVLLATAVCVVVAAASPLTDPCFHNPQIGPVERAMSPACTRAGAPPVVTLLVQIVLGLTAVAWPMFRTQEGVVWRETGLRSLGYRTGAVEERCLPLARSLDACAGCGPAAIKPAGQRTFVAQSRGSDGGRRNARAA
jgi:hypothetical protein